MSDQCKGCMLRGNYRECQTTACSQHENWMAKDLREKLAKALGAEERANERCNDIEDQRDELLEALERAERKLTAYVGVCPGDKELTEAVLPMVQSVIGSNKELTE